MSDPLYLKTSLSFYSFHVLFTSFSCFCNNCIEPAYMPTLTGTREAIEENIPDLFIRSPLPFLQIRVLSLGRNPPFIERSPHRERRVGFRLAGSDKEPRRSPPHYSEPLPNAMPTATILQKVSSLHEAILCLATKAPNFYSS